MKLTEHFNLEEFTFSQDADRNGINNTPSEAIIERLKTVASQLEHIRTLLNGLPIHVSSGYRCLALNRSIGSKDTSAHVLGWAVDFSCPAFGTPKEVAKRISESGMKYDQLICEGVSKIKPQGAWVHISFDPKMRNELLTMRTVGGIQSYTKGLP